MSKTSKSKPAKRHSKSTAKKISSKRDTARKETKPTQLATAPKLHKLLAQAGFGSRLEMEALIAEGQITVNNVTAHVGQRIYPGDNIALRGKLLKIGTMPSKPRVIVYHKPAGELVTHDDPQNRPTVFRTLPRLRESKWVSIGRLDLNTEGLLLLTNSGELANLLMHPRFGFERTYAARVLGALSNNEQQKLLNGVKLKDGIAKFNSIAQAGGKGANCWYHVKISEGRNREVRRIFESLGHAVSRLIRIQYGPITLPRYLRRGKWIELKQPALQDLLVKVGMSEYQKETAPQQQKSKPKRTNSSKRSKLIQQQFSTKNSKKKDKNKPKSGARKTKRNNTKSR